LKWYDLLKLYRAGDHESDAKGSDTTVMDEQEVEETMQGGCVNTFIFLKKKKYQLCAGWSPVPFTSHVIEQEWISFSWKYLLPL